MRFAASVAVLLLAAAVVWIALYDRFRRPAPRMYLPVVRPTALDAWEPTAPERADAEPPGPPCEDLPQKWMVFCWDGADWDIVLPLLEDGKLPHLSQLMQKGAYGNLYTIQPSLSPVLWTSVATGVSPRRHGILAFAKPRTRIQKIVNTTRQLYSNADRNVRALWNLLSEHGRQVMMVGYHNTYPAEEVEGLMVSSYLVHQHMVRTLQKRTEVEEGFSRGLIHPYEFLKEVLSMQRPMEDATPEELARFAIMEPQESDVPPSKDAACGEATRREFLRRAYLYDTFHADVARRFLPRIEPDVMALHFQGMDWAAHYFLFFHEPEPSALLNWPKDVSNALSGERRKHRNTVKAFYEYADEWLGRFLELRDPGTGVLVLSDHGFEPEHNCERTGYHDEAPPGIVVIEGPGVRRGERLSSATIYDILPTLMASLGLPVARDLDGRVLHEAFCSDALPPDSIAYVDTYEKGERYVPHAALPPVVDEEIQKQLESLGYLN